MANTGSRLPSTDLKQINANSLKLQPIPLMLVLNVKCLGKHQGSGSKLCQTLSRICPHFCLVSPRPLAAVPFDFCFLYCLGNCEKIRFTPAEHQVKHSTGQKHYTSQETEVTAAITNLKTKGRSNYSSPKKNVVPEVSLIFLCIFFFFLKKGSK